MTVDQPKVGAGNNNDGNTARKTFQNFQKFSKTAGVDEELNKRLNVIL